MKTIDTKQLEEILPCVAKPGRYLGNEWNVVKKDLDRVDVRFALAFPDIYDVGMSYTGFRIIYAVLNDREDVACERVFAVWPDLEGEMKKRAIPLFSLESKVPIKNFHILGFSLTYELNYANVLHMLSLAHIPLRRRERRSDLPLVIAGGPCAFNPEPLSAFIDAFVIGEGEEVVLEMVDVYKRTMNCELRTANQSEAKRSLPEADEPRDKGCKEKLLKALSDIEGVYVPQFPKKVTKRIVKDLDRAFYPTRELVPHVKIIHDRITIEIMRGCPFRCNFCQASSFYGPVRLRSRERVVELARALYRNTGYEEISLLSLSSGDYPGILSLVSTLIGEFQGRGVGVSLPSMRSEDVLRLLPSVIAKTRKAGLTFAPEAGTERLRRFINKNIDVEKIIVACDEAFKSGWRSVKFYFIIGLPTETDDDLEGIADFIYRVLRLKGNVEISASINAFVPKLHTYFENERMQDPGTLMKKQAFLRQRLKNKRVKLKMQDVRLSLLEWRFNQPDKQLGEVVHEAWQKGARLDSWREFFNFAIWEEAFKKVGIEL